MAIATHHVDRHLGEALADLAVLVPAEDLIHLRDTLVAAKKGAQHGTAGLELEISHGRVTDAWVSKRLRAPQPGPDVRPVLSADPPRRALL